MIYDIVLLIGAWATILVILIRIFQGAARRDRSLQKLYIFDDWRVEAIELYIDQIEGWKESGIAEKKDLDLQMAAKLALYKKKESEFSRLDQKPL